MSEEMDEQEAAKHSAHAWQAGYDAGLSHTAEIADEALHPCADYCGRARESVTGIRSEIRKPVGETR